MCGWGGGGEWVGLGGSGCLCVCVSSVCGVAHHDSLGRPQGLARRPPASFLCLVMPMSLLYCSVCVPCRVPVLVQVLVVADAGAPPAHVAADLLSQAEHGPDSQVVLAALPGVDLAAIHREVQQQCDALPRNETARKALTHSFVIQVRLAGVHAA